jgi:hypothetical protein
MADQIVLKCGRSGGHTPDGSQMHCGKQLDVLDPGLFKSSAGFVYGFCPHHGFLQEAERVVRARFDAGYRVLFLTQGAAGLPVRRGSRRGSISILGRRPLD